MSARSSGASRGEETLMGVIERYEKEGFKGQFITRAGGQVMCAACRAEQDAGELQLLAMHRLEGVSDPGEQMAVAALQCPACDARGTLVLTYGPEAPKEDSMVLTRLPDLNEGSTGIHPGV